MLVILGSQLKGQGWGQIRFIKYKYKYKYKNLDFSNTNTNTNILLKFDSNTNTSIQIQIQIRSTKYICRKLFGSKIGQFYAIKCTNTWSLITAYIIVHVISMIFQITEYLFKPTYFITFFGMTVYVNISVIYPLIQADPSRPTYPLCVPIQFCNGYWTGTCTLQGKACYITIGMWMYSWIKIRIRYIIFVFIFIFAGYCIRGSPTWYQDKTAHVFSDLRPQYHITHGLRGIAGPHAL